ncbi:hypothetical protein D9V37_06820 [Nocardioides mangrovicus]|uniref:Calpain catalytic domain-containing protein n=1 Tax=Nocardioides mangrovicus TaxID=2478913 RepID=A0A3L8P2I9_9ACTN|nr:hypothetical protein [Nocardioides mangrovicus]RLV49626.1 hypothetical protein D9V37_06820 [Nocardioides mangrovicus]
MGTVGFDVTRLSALATSIATATPGLGDLESDIATLRSKAADDMGGTPVPSDAGLTTPSIKDVGLGALDVSTEIKRRLQLIQQAASLKRLGIDIDAQPMALDVVDDTKVDDAVDATKGLLDKDCGINGNRDDLGALKDQLDRLNPEELDQVLDGLSDQELARLGDMARDTDDSGWSPFDHNGLERPERFEFFGSILSRVSPSRIPRVVAAFPELNPGFDTTDGALDENSQTGESAQGMHYGVPEGQLWRYGPDGKPVVDSSESEQGSLGDCWFIASMLAAQGADKNFIPDHMQQNPNGTISVLMGDEDGDEHWTTVTNELPLKPDGSVAMARGDYLWGSYYEKAFAQLYTGDDGGAPDGKEGDPDYDKKEVGDYGALEWDYNDKPAPYISGHGADDLGHDFDDIRDHFRDGDPVIISTKSDAPDPPSEWGSSYSTRHVYFVKSVTDSTITVGNPWGPDYPDITMTQDQFDDYYDSGSAMDLDH